MRRNLFILLLLLATSPAFSQTDSANLFYQKGLTEKQNGRLMESYKNLKTAIRYDDSNKEIVKSYAETCLNLRKYSEAREAYKKLVELGDESATTYKELMPLSYNLKQNDDVILYANKLREADPSEKVNYYIARTNYDQD
ncbi:MAG: hypothetical protein JST10_13430, partial [Bacteroidetes bacterium]|nr:hypothetical protein [Bacteroidota bacterium]